VGAGATGCEILKNFSMMGVGCKKDGAVYIADMNIIKKCHLSRQFFFRSSDIGVCGTVCF
jgi:ubiquitin-activating enzyme E1